MCKRPIFRNVQYTQWVTILTDTGEEGDKLRLYFESTYSPKINKKEKWSEYIHFAVDNEIDVTFKDIIDQPLNNDVWRRKKNDKWEPFNVLKIIHLVIKDKNKLTVFNEKFEPFYEEKKNNDNDDDEDEEDDDGEITTKDRDDEKRYYEDPRLWRKLHFDWLHDAEPELWRLVCLYFFYRVQNYIPFYDIGYAYIKNKDDITVKFNVYFIYIIHIIHIYIYIHIIHKESYKKCYHSK